MKSFFKILFVLVFLLTGFQSAKAASTEYTCYTSHKCVDLTGYAWGADNSPFGGVGWINFNNYPTNVGGSGTSSGVDYKVFFDRTDKKLHGYAWSERYGYIKFGDFDEVGNGRTYPSINACNGAVNTDTACNTQLVQVNGNWKLVGYARYCFVYNSGCSGSLRPANELGGYDGWITFSYNINSTGSGVAYNNSSANGFSGFAWGGGSGDPTNTNYAKGSGWIKMDTSSKPVKCYIVTSNTPTGDCLDDADKAKITISATPNPANYNNAVTVSWTITNIPNGCTATTSSTPTNTTWNGTTISSGAGNLASGSKNVGTISTPTTFTISCVYNGVTASASTLVDISTFTPQVTLTSTPTDIYSGQSAVLDYTITNIPYGCTAQLFANNIASGSPFSVPNSGGTSTYKLTDSVTKTNITSTTKWELQCTDSTAPAPDRVGGAKATTTVTDPLPMITFKVKDNTTGVTYTRLGTGSSPSNPGIIPCTNTGLTATYNTESIASSCKALVNDLGTDPDWGSSTSFTKDGADHDVSIRAVTLLGDPINYKFQCFSPSGTRTTNANIYLKRTCTPGSITLTTPKSCVVKGVDTIDLDYTGTGVVANTCDRSWGSNINATSFSLTSNLPTTNLTTGQSYTYSIDSCQDQSNPTGTTLSKSVTVLVDTATGCANVGTCTDGIQNGNETGVDTGGRCSGGPGTCTDGIQNGNETGIDTGGRCAGTTTGTTSTCINTSSHRCGTSTTTGGGPIFKEF